MIHFNNNFATFSHSFYRFPADQGYLRFRDHYGLLTATLAPIIRPRNDRHSEMTLNQNDRYANVHHLERYLRSKSLS